MRNYFGNFFGGKSMKHAAEDGSIGGKSLSGIAMISLILSEISEIIEPSPIFLGFAGKPFKRLDWDLLSDKERTLVEAGRSKKGEDPKPFHLRMRSAEGVYPGLSVSPLYWRVTSPLCYQPPGPREGEPRGGTLWGKYGNRVVPFVCLRCGISPINFDDKVTPGRVLVELMIEFPRFVLPRDESPYFLLLLFL
jgi:hypothetical protein